MKKLSLNIIILSFLIPLSLFSQNQEMDKPKNEPNGWISIHTFVDSFYVVLNNDFENILQVANHDTISVEAGKHQVTLIKKYYRDAVRNVVIGPDSLHTIKVAMPAFIDMDRDKKFSSYPIIAWGASVVVLSDPDATIYINDEYSGTGIARTNLKEEIDIRTELPSGRSKSITYNENQISDPFNVIELYNRKNRTKSKLLSFIPGAGQFYHNKNKRGTFIIGTLLIGAGTALKYEHEFRDQYEQFRRYEELYWSPEIFEPALIHKYGLDAQNHLSAARRSANIRDVALYSIIAAYLFNLYDSFTTSGEGYRNRIRIDPFIDYENNTIESAGIHASYRFN